MNEQPLHFPTLQSRSRPLKSLAEMQKWLRSRTRSSSKAIGMGMWRCDQDSGAAICAIRSREAWRKDAGVGTWRGSTSARSELACGAVQGFGWLLWCCGLWLCKLVGVRGRFEFTTAAAGVLGQAGIQWPVELGSWSVFVFGASEFVCS